MYKIYFSLTQATSALKEKIEEMFSGYELKFNCNNRVEDHDGSNNKVVEANQWGADLYFCVPAKTKGLFVRFVGTEDGKSYHISNYIYNKFQTIELPADTGIDSTSGIYEMTATNMTSTYIALPPVDKGDAKWFADNLDTIVGFFKEATDEYFDYYNNNKPKEPNKPSEEPKQDGEEIPDVPTPEPKPQKLNIFQIIIKFILMLFGKK